MYLGLQSPDAPCLCSFMVGYHVHEKAILMVILPLALDAVSSRSAARMFITLSVTGHYALLPLLFTRSEHPVKVKHSNERWRCQFYKESCRVCLAERSMCITYIQ